MKFIALLATASLLSLSGCAHISDGGMKLLASSVSAVAVVHDTLLQGKVVLFTDRTGTISLTAPAPAPASSAALAVPRLTCTGRLYYTATKTGVINLRCSDGTEEGLAFTALSDVRGVAQASSARGPLSVVFGMAPTDAVAYLSPPAGQRLVLGPEGQLGLEPLK